MLEHLETIEFIKKAQAGDESAKTKLIEHNTPLIKSIIRRYRNCKVEYEDLMQLGVMGLVKAINNFDLSYEVHFSTYAVPMITGEIKRFIRDDGAIKVSRSIKSLLKNIKASIKLRQK
ncbi:MAG: sigma-70 family RNA polymerase sigma factor [Clostridia bacterium]